MEQAEHLTRLRKFIEGRKPKTCNRLVDGGYRDVLSSYGAYTGKEITERFQWNCHSGIRNPGPEVMFLWSQLGDIGTTASDHDGTKEEYLGIVSEHQRAFLEWFLRESPWAPVVDEFNPDIDWTIKHGIIFGGLDTLPANFVFNAVCASRFPTEFRLCCRMWYEMVKAGACPRVAFALTTVQGWDRGMGHNKAHSAISSGYFLPVGRYENFVRVGKPDMSSAPSTQGGHSTPSNIIWDGKDRDYDLGLQAFLSRIIGRTFPVSNEDFIKIAVDETKRLKG